MAVLGALGDLVLALSADTAKFQSDLGRADRVAGKFSRDVGRSLGVLTGAFIALGGATGILVRSQINAADEAGKMAQKVGMSVESLSAYMVAAQLADVSNQQLQTGFQQLAKNQADFVAGTGEAKDAFAALGITTQQVNALNGDTAALFELVAGKLAQFEDGANKTALAMKIFGRSGAELIPLINELEQTRKEAEMLGAVLDKETAAAAEKFNDELTRVGISVRAVGLGIAKAVLPTLESMSGKMVQAAKDTQGMSNAGEIANTGLKLLASAGTIIATTFQIVGERIGGAAAIMSQFAQGNFREAWHTLTSQVRDTAQRMTEAIDSLDATWNSTASTIRAKSKNTGGGLAAPALVALDKIQAAREKALREAEKTAQEALRFEEMVAEDMLGASEALKDMEIKNAAERELAFKRVTESQIESARIAVDLAESMIFTWDAAGNRIEITREAFDELESQQKDNTKFARDMGFTFTSAFEDAVIGGKKLSDVLKGLSQDIARIILRKSITEPLGAAISGSISGSGIGDFFKKLLPKFDAGTDFVPRDMIAQVHKGEAIIPAGQNTGGGDLIVNINAQGADPAELRRVEIAVRDLHQSFNGRVVGVMRTARMRGMG